MRTLREHFGAVRAADLKAVVGFDGFIDEIIHVVEKRENFNEFDRMMTISDFARRIESAAGKSANIEFVSIKSKIGGNGPIMAEALAQLGTGITYIGNLGIPEIHPVFYPLAARASVISLAEPAHTDAIEFSDGKIMFGKMEVLRTVAWERIVEIIPLPRLIEIISDAKLLAMVNWTMAPGMTDIWRHLLKEVCPLLSSGRERFAFFDLADPEKRYIEDLQDALRLIGRFSDTHKVIFGLNEREGVQVANALNAPKDLLSVQSAIPSSQSAIPNSHHISEALSKFIASELGVYAVVIHPVDCASATVDGRTYTQTGPYTDSPVITTGAGDHFNAGFCLGLITGLDPQVSLLLGVNCSGYYVRTGGSPDISSLLNFIDSGEID
ncbi:MAG: hypothetical protein AB1546_00165, partial [bacterium]